MILTNLEQEIEVLYRGTLNFETKEGETVVITGYFPDAENRKRMIGTSYMTNHSLEAENWDSKIYIYNY